MVKTSLALFNLINIISITMIHNSYINILSKENEISQLIFKGVNNKKYSKTLKIFNPTFLLQSLNFY